MLALPAGKQVDLSSSGIECAGIFPAHPEQQNLRDIPKVEAHAAPVGAAILPHLVPDKIRFVLESPFRQDDQAGREKRIRNPEIAMGGFAMKSITGKLAISSTLRVS